MIRTILMFVVITVFIGMGIEVFRNMTGREKWKLTKSIAYALLCSSITFIVLSIVVILF